MFEHYGEAGQHLIPRMNDKDFSPVGVFERNWYRLGKAGEDTQGGT